MNIIWSRPLTDDELVCLVKNRHVRVECSCGNTLMVWPNRNARPFEQVRCLKCASEVSYTLNVGPDLESLIAWQVLPLDEYYHQYHTAARWADDRVHS